MIVYKIVNKINGKSYVGQTVRSLRIRFLQHCKSHSHCTALNKAIQKYGAENFASEILFESECKQQITKKEIYFIKELSTMAPLGYNLTEGGESASHTPESRKKLSEAKKGAKNPQFGKKRSFEARAKTSTALKGRKRPQWVKDKIRASHNPKSNKNLTYRRKPMPTSPLVPNGAGQ
jgi:group I intron endonuclease